MAQKYNLYLRKDGRYEGRIAIGRKPDGSIRYRYLYNKDQAKLKILMDREMANHYVPVLQTKTRFNSLFDLWFDSKKGKLRASTLSIYRCYLDKHLRPAIGKRYIETCTTEKLQEICVTELFKRSDGKGILSSKSCTDILRVLKNILKYGETQGISCHHLKIDYPKREYQKVNVFRETEQVALERVLIANISDRVALGIYLCLYTGLRVGELCGLQWEDIDIKNGVIFVRRTVQRISIPNEKSKTKVVIGDPKSITSKREIPIPNHLLAIITKLKPQKENLYFLSDTSTCYEPRRIQGVFHRYLDLAGLSRRGIHCTRHTFATRWIELGVDIKTLSEILGHSSINITLDKYVHISEKVKRDNINKLTPYISLRT